LTGIATVNDLFGHALREVKEACGRIWLMEIVEEEALFAAKFENVAALKPKTAKNCTSKGVRELRVGAALVEER